MSMFDLKSMQHANKQARQLKKLEVKGDEQGVKRLERSLQRNTLEIEGELLAELELARTDSRTR